ncbi:MAG: hypothetical protein ABI668_15085, partial [Sphingorhabdus sp.]
RAALQEGRRAREPPVLHGGGWAKCSAGFAKVKLRGKQKVAALFTMAICAYNLIRIPKILAQSA